jgi:hypothetical protein
MNSCASNAVRHILFALAIAASCPTAPAQTTSPTEPITSPQASSSLATEPASAPAAAPAPAPHSPHVETSVSLGVAPQLTASRVSTGQSLDPSPAVLATFRQSFRPWLGYSVNLGYTRTTEHNDTAYAAHYDIPASMYELSLSYLTQRHITRRLTAFADLGAGMVSFLPTGSASLSSPNGVYRLPLPVTFRPLGVAGFGFDYRYTPHLALRAEYRGLLYKYADYGVGLNRAITVSSQPTLSLVYNFTPKPH